MYKPWNIVSRIKLIINISSSKRIVMVVSTINFSFFKLPFVFSISHFVLEYFHDYIDYGRYIPKIYKIHFNIHTKVLMTMYWSPIWPIFGDPLSALHFIIDCRTHQELSTDNRFQHLFNSCGVTIDQGTTSSDEIFFTFANA